jgi:hypothetical protein
MKLKITEFFSCFTTGNATALTNTIWLHFTMHFGLRGVQEHVQMFWGDIELMVNSDGNEYLQFTERQTKTRQGNSRTSRAYPPKMFASEKESKQ